VGADPFTETVKIPQDSSEVWIDNVIGKDKCFEVDVYNTVYPSGVDVAYVTGGAFGD
jgi:hypothetical protein